MPQKPSTRTSDSGLTYIETLIAMSLTLVLLAGGLALALTSRGIFDKDQNRTVVNQNLRSGMDLIGMDIRQAGGGLPADMPALLIQDGTSGAPDTLTLRVKQLDDVLPVCADIVSGTTIDTVTVAKNSGTIPPGCPPVPDNDADTWPDNMGAWRTHRIANAGAVWAYIYNPATKVGEFFQYDSEDSGTFTLHKANGDAWANNYNTADQARVYILEQRQFQLGGSGILECAINQDTANPLGLIEGVLDFQARALFQDGSSQASLAATDAWADLESIEIIITGRKDDEGHIVERSLINNFVPRNVLSL